MQISESDIRKFIKTHSTRCNGCYGDKGDSPICRLDKCRKEWLDEAYLKSLKSATVLAKIRQEDWYSHLYSQLQEAEDRVSQLKEMIDKKWEASRENFENQYDKGTLKPNIQSLLRV